MRQGTEKEEYLDFERGPLYAGCVCVFSFGAHFPTLKRKNRRSNDVDLRSKAASLASPSAVTADTETEVSFPFVLGEPKSLGVRESSLGVSHLNTDPSRRTHPMKSK